MSGEWMVYEYGTAKAHYYDIELPNPNYSNSLCGHMEATRLLIPDEERQRCKRCEKTLVRLVKEQA